MKKKISIAIPCFNEEKNISSLYKRIDLVTRKLKKYQFEFIIVDNKSTDNTKAAILRLAKKDKRIKGLFLSRNFGPEASATASYTYATGDAVIAIAGDMQDPPELIPQFVNAWENGKDIVFGVYTNAIDPFFITWMRKAFYRIFKSISNIDVPVNATGFGLVSRKALNAFLSLPEKFRFSRGILSWVGFNRSYIYYKRMPRSAGNSSYNTFGYMKHAERGLFGFSYLILDAMVYCGFVLVLFSFLFIVGYLYTVVVIGNPIKASIPTLLAIVFFGGIQLLAISVIGKYIQVIVEETKARPVFIVDETVNIKKSI